MCRIGKIKNGNVAGVNLSGIGIFVNQSIENKKDDAQTTTSAKVYAIGIVRGWTMFWVIVSSLLSIGAIAFCCACLPRIVSDINPHYDYLGIVIGVLALFITFLVAWNIWATITTKEDVKEMKQTADKLNIIEEQVKSLRNAPDAYLFYILAIGKFEKQEYYDAFEYFAIATRTFIDNNIPYEKFSTVALSYMESCLDMAYSSGKDMDVFKNRAQEIHRRIDSIMEKVGNVGKFTDEAKGKIDHIRSKAQQYGIIIK